MDATLLRRMLADVRYELIPLGDARAKAEWLPPGATVTVTASPRHGMDATLSLAAWLQARGHTAIPHLSARLIRDRVHLTDILERARTAQLTQAFVVGGDAGPGEGLGDGLTLLRAMNEIGHPFGALGVPAYPEGHPSIPDEVLVRALTAKAAYAHSVTTQMSFDAGAIVQGLGRMRAAGLSLPVYVGAPGAIEPHQLVAVAARIGVAGSARYLAKNRRLLGALLRTRAFTPEALLNDLTQALSSSDGAVAGVHLFTFNQVAETVAWTRDMVERLG